MGEARLAVGMGTQKRPSTSSGPDEARPTSLLAAQKPQGIDKDTNRGCKPRQGALKGGGGCFAARAGRGLLLLSVAGKCKCGLRSFQAPLCSCPIAEFVLRESAAEQRKHETRQDQRNEKRRCLQSIRMHVMTA